VAGERDCFVHEASLTVTSDFDDRGPGGAVTVALCGSLDHDPPCPSAPHQTSTTVSGARAAVRVVFACLPADEHLVRERIESAMALGEFRHDGDVTTWTLVATNPAPLDAEELVLGERLAAT
jgi:hypothetical protein